MSNCKEIFEKLSAINVNEYKKEKLGLSYLSWADAWKILKSNYPDAEMKIYTRMVNTETETTYEEDGMKKTIRTSVVDEIPYFTDGKTCFVKVGVIIDGVELFELLPVMDMKNKSVRTDLVTSVDVNRAIQRAFVKACARHGLGLYVYSGEDLPEAEKKEKEAESEAREQLALKTLNYVNSATLQLDNRDFQDIYLDTKKLCQTVLDKLGNEFLVKVITNFFPSGIQNLTNTSDNLYKLRLLFAALNFALKE